MSEHPPRAPATMPASRAPHAAAAFRNRVALGALVALLVLGAVAGLLAWRQYEDAQRNARNGLRARAFLATAVLDTYFQGQLAALQAMASSPVVVDEDEAGMAAYFKRVQAGNATGLSGGVGWVDARGVSRVSSTTGTTEPGTRVADRSYFKAVMATGKPFVSEGITTRRSQERVVVLAVPTLDAAGRPSGLLAGALLLRPTGVSAQSIRLGFGGLAVLDRTGQSVLTGFTRPANTRLVARMRQARAGVFDDTAGLDARSGHVVAFATSAVPAWLLVLDQPASDVFASARRGLLLAVVLIAGAVAMALALLARLLRRARREAERQEHALREQRELTRTFVAASATTEVAEALAASLASTLPGTRATVALASDDRLGVRVAAAAPGRFELLAQERAVAELAEEAYASGIAVALADETAIMADQPRLYDVFPVGSHGSAYAVPVESPAGERLGAVALLCHEEAALDDDALARVATLAREAGQALERTRVQEREHEVASTLQRSLLPDALPSAPGIDLTGRYQAGAAGLEIGGDWYDAVLRDDGVIVLSVGDVAGHGVEAAALMGQLRNAFRAYALDHEAPAAIVRRMGRHVALDGMATAVVLAIAADGASVRYASAGHPPVLALDEASGRVQRLDGAGGPPLGVAVPEPPPEAVLALPPGTTLVAYTDGLVERRDALLDVGIERLAATVAGLAGATAAAMADGVLRTILAERAAQDDVALLVVRRPPQ
jgi:serine phosphatase RsbU (regulator of sigma subunit)